MFGLFDWMKVAAGVVFGLSLGYPAGYWRGDNAGYDRHVAEIAINDGKAEIERKGDDAELQSMSDYDLCVVGLRAQRMPVNACEQLRGLSEGEP